MIFLPITMFDSSSNTLITSLILVDPMWRIYFGQKRFKGKKKSELMESLCLLRQH